MILRNVCNYDIQSTTATSRASIPLQFIDIMFLDFLFMPSSLLWEMSSLYASGLVDVIVADRPLEDEMGDAHMIIQAATCLELQKDGSIEKKRLAK
ncbi:unnamed protein product, partial [Brassica oleracea]